MPNRGHTPREFVAAVLLALLSNRLGPALGTRSQGREEIDPSGRVSRSLARSIHIALEEATDKLRARRCRTVFLDFTDRRSRRLAQNLEATGRSGSEYLQGLQFDDGSGSLVCERRDVIAFTSPGSRTVSVCGQRFAELVHRNRSFAAIILIHEALHSLGLGEDPPSSREITSRVVARCGL
jgi:hypothetical protein